MQNFIGAVVTLSQILTLFVFRIWLNNIFRSLKSSKVIMILKNNGTFTLQTSFGWSNVTASVYWLTLFFPFTSVSGSNPEADIIASRWANIFDKSNTTDTLHIPLGS